MTDGEGKIKFPINEPAEGKRKSQIEEYLEFHGGPGVQHVALQSEDIVKTVAALREHGVLFIRTPDTYYEDVEERVGEIDQDWDDLRSMGILVDRGRGGLPAPALHEDRPGPADALLRGHRAPRLARLRDRELQGALRGDRARAGATREPLRRRRRAAPRLAGCSGSRRPSGRTRAPARAGLHPLPDVLRREQLASQQEGVPPRRHVRTRRMSSGAARSRRSSTARIASRHT